MFPLNSLLNVKTAACIAIAVVGVGMYSHIQSQAKAIDVLKAENLDKAQTILEQATVNQTLTVQLEQEQQAVRNQQEIANELRKQAEVKRESIKTILVKEPCGRVPMPRAVIEQLQQPTH